MAKKKAEKTSPFVPVEEQPYCLPENWEWIRCWAIADLFNGDRGINYPSKKDYVQQGIPFINAGTIKDGGIDYSLANYITEDKYQSLHAGKILKNDILYCLRGSLGKTAIIRDEVVGAISSSLCILRTKPNINREYFFWLLQSDCIQLQQQNVDNGTAQPNLSAGSVLNYSIPFPPLAEQQRIVDRIESLFAKLDEAKEKAQEALDSFEIRKNAILHEAFSGKLTKSWRRQHKEAHLAPSFCENVRQYEISENYPCDVPETWKWYHMGGIGYTNIGLTYKPSDKSEDGIIVLRSSNIQNGTMDYNDIVKVSVEIPDNKMCKKGDILICARNGSKSLVGKTAIVDRDGMSFGAFMAIFRCKNNRYVYYFLNSPFFRNIIDQDVGTTTINQVTQAIIKNLPIPIAPEVEQSEIVRILDDFFAKEAEAKERVEATIEAIEAMKKSILAKAFRGELGTNNPADESAEELLKQTMA